MARAKETVAIVRGLLTQTKFSYDGQWFKPHDFHLRERPIGDGAQPIPCHAASESSMTISKF